MTEHEVQEELARVKNETLRAINERDRIEASRMKLDSELTVFHDKQQEIDGRIQRIWMECSTQSERAERGLPELYEKRRALFAQFWPQRKDLAECRRMELSVKNELKALKTQRDQLMRLVAEFASGKRDPKTGKIARYRSSERGANQMAFL